MSSPQVPDDRASTAAPSPNAPSDAPASAAATPSPSTPAVDTGAVFTISNATDANEVLAFTRNADGMLAAAGVYPTGGRGTGKSLGSQGAVALSADGKLLVVVDAGTNQISSFTVDGAKLSFVSRVSSGGVAPTSVAIHEGLVYALNAGDASNASSVSGFKADGAGKLSVIEGSTHTLSTANPNPAQVAFAPKGDMIVVTEKATNMIDTFVVRQDGSISDGESTLGAGMTPFGFAITKDGVVVVSEAFGAMAGKGAVSSYAFDAMVHAAATGGAERGISAVSSSIANAQTAPCWVAVTPDGKMAYTANTPSATISAYGIDATGKLSLVGDGAAAKTGDGSKPVDMAIDKTSKHLYVLNSGTQQIKAMDIAADGSLTAHLDGNPDVPASAFGLAGY